MGRLRAAIALGGCALLASGCLGGSGPIRILGENFPPHDIAFVQYEAPEFPSRLRPTSTSSGYGVVVVTVATTGQVEDAVVVEATHPAFTEAILEATPSWVFRGEAGRSIPRREILHFVFRRSGVATSLTHREGARAAFESSESARPRVRMVSSEQLAPQPVTAAPPALAIDGAAHGVVEVSFVVDESGHVRVPAVTAATHPSLAAPALAAVKAWRFAPPTDDDEPVLIEVVQTFRVGPSGQ